MRQAFPPGANALARASILAVVFLIPIIALFSALWVRSDYARGDNIVIEQPVPFSHEHHVDGLGLDCRYCHTSVEESAFAGMPDTHTCMTCHSQVWTNAPNLEVVRQSYRLGQPISWNRVHDLPDYVHFNHAAHINNGVACETCHGEVDEMPMMWQSKTLFMEWCLSCHRNPQENLRPQSAIFDMDWENVDSETLTTLLQEYNIRPSIEITECTTCHQ